MTDFQGFSSEMPDFLFRLQFHNTIDEQADNLIIYKQLISKPLRELYETLLPIIYELDADLETRPARCISTPYTDRRFSPSVPLKEYMYLRFKQRNKTRDIPGLYFDMGCEYYSYGLRVYKQTSRGMDAIRERIAATPEQFCNMLDDLNTKRFTVFGESYKTDHCPWLAEGSAKDLYNRRSFYIGKNVPIGEHAFSAKLAEELTEGFRAVAPLLSLLSVPNSSNEDWFHFYD